MIIYILYTDICVWCVCVDGLDMVTLNKRLVEHEAANKIIIPAIGPVTCKINNVLSLSQQLWVINNLIFQILFDIIPKLHLGLGLGSGV